MPKPSILHKILTYTLLPMVIMIQPIIFIVHIVINNYLLDKNAINKWKKNNKINYYYSKLYDLKKLKDYKHREKVSLNDCFAFLYLRSI